MTPMRRWITLTVVAVVALGASALQLPFLGPLGTLIAVLLIGGLLVGGFMFLMRRLLWRVGRRLAFSYFLLGVLPIPMVLLLLFVASYLLSGFFLGHLYRSATVGLTQELHAAAETRLASWNSSPGGDGEIPVMGFLSEDATVGAETPPGTLAFAQYKDGRRISGDTRAPEDFPQWLVLAGNEPGGNDSVSTGRSSSQQLEAAPLVTLETTFDEEENEVPLITLAAGSTAGRRAVLVFYDGDFNRLVSQRSGVWTELFPQGTETGGTTISLFDQEFHLIPPDFEGGSEGRYEYLADNDSGNLPIIGFELAGPLLALEGGEQVSESVSATLTATSQVIINKLFSKSPEIDTFAWLAFLIPAFLLFDVYALAALMAIVMIFALSRAVNRLSKATAGVQRGDFSSRIPVRRRDQIGALQSDFNSMTENLEDLVSQAAQKEVLERELDIAQEVQTSLLPSAIDHDPRFQFATHFAPSAAIAGDYYDIMEFEADEAGGDRLVIVVADVAGHGLSAGLRMAMIKAGLITLVQENKPPDSILSSLDQLVRSTSDRRAFVTATLSMIDLDDGTLSVTNAGHLPTYILRGNEVQEILLEGTPLGVLGTTFGHQVLDIEPNDVLVWLSDGIIEATDGRGNQFGFEATVETLRNQEGVVGSAVEIRDRLLMAVSEHSHYRPPEDDRTLVVMKYLGPETSSTESSENSDGLNQA